MKLLRCSLVLFSMLSLLACETNSGSSPSDVASDARPNDAGDTEDVVCVPNCTNRECGPDPVCGVSCGECVNGDLCIDGTCPCCRPDCGDRECGPDPICPGYYCGENGGNCLRGECNADGYCECVPSCAGRECGDDGCGGSCGTCEPTSQCADSGVCVSVPCTGTACFDWFDCAEVCPQGPSEQQCWIECDDALRPESLEAKNVLVDCQTTACGDCADSACLADCTAIHCADQSLDCLLTYGCGTGTCADWHACVAACPDAETNADAYADCEEDCHRSSSEQGLRDVHALRVCLEEACPSTVSPEERRTCAQSAAADPEKCQTEAEACPGAFD